MPKRTARTGAPRSEELPETSRRQADLQASRRWTAALGAAVFTSVFLGGLFLAQAKAQNGTPAPVAAPVESAPAPSLAASPQLLNDLATAGGRDAFIKQYCTSCHDQRLKTGGLVLEGASTSNAAANAELWEKVVKRVGAGEMPPPRAPRRPEAQAAHAFVGSLVRDLDFAAKKQVYAGPYVVRRLNRTEYGNAVRDLLDIDFPFAAELPTDGLASGFDNIGDALSMSPVLLESYLRVARKVSELAAGVTDPSPVTEVFFATKSQGDWIGEGAPFGTRGGVIVRKFFPREGEYELRAILVTDNGTITEGERLFRARVRVKPGLHTFVATFPAENAMREGPIPDLPGQGGKPLGGPLDVRGSAVRPTLWFLVDGAKVKDFAPRGLSASDAAQGVDADAGPPIVVRTEISGPYGAGPVVDTASRRRVFVCHPSRVSEEAACAERIVRTITRRAFRRDVTDSDLKPILATFRRGRAQHDFDIAITYAVRDILVSPDFLFRLEFEPSNARPNVARRVSDYELATRLSFFLWSGPPDDQLLDDAKAGKLRTRAGLESEVRRLLADRRSEALVDNFGAQWLSLRDLAEVTPDAQVYRDFDEGLRDSYLQETRLFLRSIMRENRSILDVINADYTFLNERLADIYGLPGVKGPAFRRVQLADNSVRRGVLGQGSVLLVTSHPTKTSPILRGKWILDNLLNSPPPPPPPGVPPLDEGPAKGRVLTTREQVERHRASRVCASCHDRMDPLGFALENFDVMGRWRTRDDGGTIDATGLTAAGDKISGPDGLRKALVAHSDDFAGATVQRLMTYGLGRPLEAQDQPAVRQIITSTKPSGYRFVDIVLAVVGTPQFQMKQTSSQR